MRKLILAIVCVAMLLMAPGLVAAYDINDSPANDSIGYPIYETYGINVTNFTPGVNNGAIGFQLFSNFPQAGHTVGSWLTLPADVFITEYYQGVDYQWAVPLVSHDGFNAGTTYAVGSYKISDDLQPAGGYTYNHNVAVQISSLGSNYGYDNLGAGSVAWNAGGGLPR